MHWLSKAYWTRAMRDPVVAAGLAIDVIPVIGVLFLGWGAAALVMLYWLENLVIGVFTLGRILLAAVASSGLPGLVYGGFISVFFTVHYGMFCMGHGHFLFSFVQDVDKLPIGLGFGPLLEMVLMVFEFWPALSYVLLIVSAWQAFVFASDDIEYAREHSNQMNPVKEMFAPYGRIIILHVGIFAGAFALISLGDPMIGVLALILFRAAFGVAINQYRRSKLDRRAFAAEFDPKA